MRQRSGSSLRFRIGLVKGRGKVRFLRSAAKGADPAGQGIFGVSLFWPTGGAVPTTVPVSGGKVWKPWIYVLLFSLFWLGLWHHGGLAAEEKAAGQPGDAGSAKSAPTEVRFLRVYAPADRVGQWPWGDMKYVPVDGAELERLIRLGEPSVSGPMAQAKISWLKGRAAFSEPGVLEGECLLDIRTPNQQAGVLRWPKWPLAIRTAVWVDAEGKALEPASLGLSESGQTELAASRTGQLRLEWSLQGRQEGAGVRFDLGLPPCPHTELRLEVPESLRPVLPGALIRIQEPPPAPGRKIWLFEWSGPIGGPLRLVPEEGPSSSPKMLVQQETQYTLLPEGLEAVGRFTIQPLGEPVSEVSFLVEAGLEVTAVQSAGQSLCWRWEAGPGAGPRRLWVLLPQPIHKEVPTLEVEVVGPVVLAAPWPLPRIRLEGAIWQQGRWTLRIGSGLEVQRIGCSNCRQSKAGWAGAELGPGGENFEFQAYGPEAAVEVVLARTEPVAHVDVGTVVIFSERQINARIRARVRAEAGEHFVLQAQVGRRWLIDAVEADSATQVEDWTVDLANQRLTIRLARPVSAQRPVSLQMVARRLQSPVGRTWRTEDLLPVRFTGLREGKHLVVLSSPDAASYELICLTPEPGLLLNPRQLESGDGELVDKISEGLFFWAGPQNQAHQWLLRPRIAQYRAKIQVDVVASAKSVSERYRMECIPEGSRVDRVVIIFSHTRTEPLQWAISGDTERPWTVRRLTEKDLPSDQLPPGGEAWEIQLRPSRSGTFVIQAQRSTPLGDQMPVALVALPQAVQQEATLRVRTVGPESPQIVSCRMTPIPSAPEDVLPGWTAQVSSFRYDPKQDVFGQTPALLLRPLPEGAAGRQTWIWQARLESWIQPDGFAKHRAIYWLVNFQRNQLTLKIPEDAEATQIEGVWIGGQPARWQVQKETQKGSGLSVQVVLEPVQTFSSLVIAFQTQQPPLRHGGKLRPCWPCLDVPVLGRTWTLWLPTGWEARCPSEDMLLQGEGTEPGESAAISVRERLFGIWARPKDQPPFDPFDREHWERLFGSDPALQRDQKQAEAFFQAVGELLRKPPRSPAAASPAAGGGNLRWTWGDLLQQEAVGQVGKIWIDCQGLWEAGIDPASPVGSSPSPTGEPESRLARAAFWQARLALGIYQGMILITSYERASGWPGWTKNLGDPLVWRILPELGDRLLGVGKLGMESLLVPPEIWQDCAPPALPAVMGLGQAVPETSLPGWTAYSMEISESPDSDRPWEITLWDQHQAQAWYWAAFFSAGGLGLWVAKRGRFFLLAAAGLLAGVTLLVPDGWIAPASGAFGGMLLAGAVALLRPRGQPAEEARPPAGSASEAALPSRPGSASGSSSGRVITVGMWAMAAVLGIAEARSAEATTAVASPAGGSPLYRVFIPVDDQQQPTGDPYQVPEPFYQYLRRRAQMMAPSASAWRLRQALYRAELTRSAMTGRGEISRIHLSWQCDLAGKVSQISLPLSREQFPVVAGTWLVEGEPIEPQWNQAGTMLIVPIPVAAPTVRLEGQVRPVPWEQGPLQGIDMAIPPTPQSRLELSLPPDAPEVRPEGALGMIKRAEEPTPRLIVELGPSERLSLRWPAGWTPSAEPLLPELDELLWLRVHPGAVLLEGRFRVSVGQASGLPQGLRVMADHRLRLLACQGPGGEEEVKISPSVGGQVFEFPLRFSPQQQTVVLAARFLMSDTIGLGNLRLPKLEPLQVRVGRRWLAVSVDPSLEYPEPLPTRTQAVPIEEFLNLWGSADLPPQFVDNLAAVGPGWTLVSRPRTPNSSVEQTLWLGYGEKMVRLFYEARVTTPSGPCFQHRLQTPPDLRIETISIWQDNTALPIRWARGSHGKVNIFSFSPLTGRYELRLTGSCPSVMSQRHPIPYVELEGAETEWDSLVLCRQPEVLLRLGKTEGLTEMDSPPSMEGKAAFGRLFKAFAVDARQIGEAELQVLPNRPQASCQQITLIRPEADRWLAEVEFRLQVQKGLVDEILLEVPASWPGPYQTTPQGNLSVKELSEGRRAIVLRPPMPVEQSYRIRITGPIHWTKATLQELPLILPLQIPVTEHLVLLPVQDPLRPLVWHTQGLEKTELPEPFAQELLGQGVWEAYRAIGGQFTARLQPAAEQTGPEVRLADIHLRWQADGACSGKASFYLLPGGQDRCVVCLPPQFQLLHLQVDNNPSPPILREEGERYTVFLASATLPQRVEVSFLGVLPPGVWEGIHPFPAPWIDHWTVATSLWTIYPPQDYELAEPEGVGRVSPLRLDGYRLRTVGSLLEFGCRQMAEPREDFLRWYWVWRERFSAMVRQVHRQLAVPPSTELHRSLRAEVQSFQLKLAQLADSLGIAEPQAGSPTGRPVSADEAKLWFDWLEGKGTVCRAVLHAPSQGLLLTYRPNRSSSWFWRGLWAATGASLGLMLAWAASKLPPHSWLLQWPHLLGLFAGGIWWLWLWPSAVGWLLILLALLRGVRKEFPTAHTRLTRWRL
jgi:hypothetical protein